MSRPSNLGKKHCGSEVDGSMAHKRLKSERREFCLASSSLAVSDLRLTSVTGVDSVSRVRPKGKPEDEGDKCVGPLIRARIVDRFVVGNSTGLTDAEDAEDAEMAGDKGLEKVSG
jgi:hypothetical protein